MYNGNDEAFGVFVACCFGSHDTFFCTSAELNLQVCFVFIYEICHVRALFRVCASFVLSPGTLKTASERRLDSSPAGISHSSGPVAQCPYMQVWS